MLKETIRQQEKSRRALTRFHLLGDVFEGFIWFHEPHRGEFAKDTANARGLVHFGAEYVYVWGNTVYHGTQFSDTSEETLIVIPRCNFVYFEGAPHVDYLIHNNWDEIDHGNKVRDKALEEI